MTQNICITPNGIHPDLEIKIIPVGVARPGFSATYEVFYKNKGTKNESPILDFHFSDAVLEFIYSTVIPNTQSSDLLTWNLGVLQPFESGSFSVTFRINAPTDIPSVNANDII